MSAAADAWRRAVLELRAWRVLTGRAQADERDRLYHAVRHLPDGPDREAITLAIELGLELGVPDRPSHYEREAGLAPPIRRPDWLATLCATAHPAGLSRYERSRAHRAILVLRCLDTPPTDIIADQAYRDLILRCARERPVPEPVADEVHDLVRLAHTTPQLASARHLLLTAQAGRPVPDWQIARAIRDTRAVIGEPWASWLAWTAVALQRTITDTV